MKATLKMNSFRQVMQMNSDSLNLFLFQLDIGDLFVFDYSQIA